MLYDSVNHIVLDDKNNGTISVNFQADDYNILAGGQQLCVEFYKSCADDTSGAISVDGITGKVLRLKTDGEYVPYRWGTPRYCGYPDHEYEQSGEKRLPGA